MPLSIFPHAPQVLPLHARRLHPHLHLTRLVDHPYHPERVGRVVAQASATRCCRRSRAMACSHLAVTRNCCRVRAAVPAARAIGSTVLHGRSDSSPRQ